MWNADASFLKDIANWRAAMSSRRRISLPTAIVAGLLLGLTSTSQAAEQQNSDPSRDPSSDPSSDPSNDIFALSLEELMQIKVSGSTFTEERLERVPSAVTVFTGDQIRRLAIDNVEELLNLVPGYQRFRQGGDGLIYTYSSRGRRINSGVGEVLTLVDGLQLASPRVANHVNTLAGVAVANIERVEFIRGPGSALYGSNAMMGVINIVTTSGRNELRLLGGSFDRKAGDLQYANDYGSLKFDLHARADGDDGDRYVVRDTFSSDWVATSDERSLSDVYLKLNWQDSFFYYRHGKRGVDDFYVFDLVSNDINQMRSWRNQYMFEQRFDLGAVQNRLTLSATDDLLELSAQLLPEGALAAISSPSSSDALITRAVFKSSNVQLAWHSDWRLAVGSVQAGVDLRRTRTTRGMAYNNFDLYDLANGQLPVRYYGEQLPTTPLEELSTRDNFGLYLQYLRPLNQTTDLTLGLRWDDYREIGEHLSPRLGLIHQLDSVHTVKLLYGEAFRAPTNGELDLINNPVILGNPDLKPEQVATWDLIWMANWRQAAVSLGYFDNRFEDSIIASSQGGLIRYENSDQGPSKGFEFELSYQLNDAWLLRTTALRLTEKPIDSFREADSMFSLALNWQQEAWRGGLTAVHHGKREMATAGSASTLKTLDDYWQLDGKLTYLVTPTLDIFVQAKNALDKRYYTPPQSFTLTNGTPNRGREWAVGFDWKF